ncbi:MAG: hypothetical protein FK734_14960 [Asgard group archaeon]|nr:hypothetical protein [Asgard group archaeon]
MSAYQLMNKITRKRLITTIIVIFFIVLFIPLSSTNLIANINPIMMQGKGIKFQSDALSLLSTKSSNSTYVYITHIFSNPTEIIDLAFSGNTAYVLSDQEEESGLYAINLLDPSQPYVCCQYTSFEGALIAIAINETYAYVASDRHFYIFDISIPNQINLVGDLYFSNIANYYCSDLYVKGIFAYIPSQAGGIYVVSVANPANPFIFYENNPLIEYQLGYTVVVNNDDILCYGKLFDGADFYNFTNPLYPELKDTYISGGSVSGVDCDGSTFFLAEKYNGLGIIDATNVSNVQKLVTYYNYGPPKDVVYNSGKVFLAIQNKGLEIVDVSNYSNPIQLYSNNLVNNPTKIAIRDNRLFMIGHLTNGLYFYGLDSDGDKLADVIETDVIGTDPNFADTDSDGLSDYDEYYIYLTDPLNDDTDSDSYLDGVEIANGWDPNNPYDPALIGIDTDEDGLSDIDEFYYETDRFDPDTDNDNLLDGEEVYLYFTNPNYRDTDFDGIYDGDEVLIYFTNPLDRDSDSDNLTDYEEIFIYGTDPWLIDTDGDSFSDEEEIIAGTDPLNPRSNPNMRHFLTKQFPYIISSLLLLFLLIILSVLFLIKARKRKLFNLFIENLSFPNISYNWLNELNIPTKKILKKQSVIDNIANYLIKNNLKGEIKSCNKGFTEFLLENNYSPSDALLALKILSSDFTFKISTFDITEIKELDNYFLNRLSIIYSNNTPTLYDIFAGVEKSLINFKIFIAYMNYCLSNPDIPYEILISKNLKLIDELDTNINKLIIYIEKNKQANIQSLHIVNLAINLDLSLLTILNLLKIFEYNDCKTIRQLVVKQSLLNEKSNNPITIVFDNKALSESYAKQLFDYWTKNKKYQFDIGEIAYNFGINKFSLLYDTFEEFIELLIVENLEILSTGEQFSLTVDKEIISKILNNKTIKSINDSRLKDLVTHLKILLETSKNNIEEGKE